MYSRADRRIGPALLDIGTGRASFARALARHGLDTWQYAIRPRRPDELLCWEVVDQGIRGDYLRDEYDRALRGLATRPCEPALCRRCGVCREAASA